MANILRDHARIAFSIYRAPATIPATRHRSYSRSRLAISNSPDVWSVKYPEPDSNIPPLIPPFPNPKYTNALFVDNLPVSAYSDEVTDVFSKFGFVKGVSIGRTLSNTTTSAIIEFEDAKDAVIAYETNIVRPIRFKGRSLTVKPSTKSIHRHKKTLKLKGVGTSVEGEVRALFKGFNVIDVHFVPARGQVTFVHFDSAETAVKALRAVEPLEKGFTLHTLGPTRYSLQTTSLETRNEKEVRALFKGFRVTRVKFLSPLNPVFFVRFDTAESASIACKKALTFREVKTVKFAPDLLKVSVLPGSTNTLFVGNVPLSANVALITQIFGTFGVVKDVFIAPRKGERSSVWAYVDYENAQDTVKAYESSAVNPIHIGDRHLKVQLFHIPEPSQSLPIAGAIFVQNVPVTANTSRMKEIFSKFGIVKDLRIARSRGNGSRTFAHVDFQDAKDAVKACESSEVAPIYYEDRELRLELSNNSKYNSYKNLKWNGEHNILFSGLHSSTTTKGPSPSVSANALFVGNIPISASAARMTQLFAKFGTVKDVHIEPRLKTRSYTFAYVEFENTEDAIRAYQSSTGSPIHLQDRTLEVEWFSAGRRAGNNVLEMVGSDTCDEAEIRAFFNNFNITDIRFVSQGPRVLVKFDSAETAAEALKKAKAIGKGFWFGTTVGVLETEEVYDEKEVQALFEGFGVTNVSFFPPLKALIFIKFDNTESAVEALKKATITGKSINIENVKFAEPIISSGGLSQTRSRIPEKSAAPAGSCSPPS